MYYWIVLCKALERGNFFASIWKRFLLLLLRACARVRQQRTHIFKWLDTLKCLEFNFPYFDYNLYTALINYNGSRLLYLEIWKSSLCLTFLFSSAKEAVSFRKSKYFSKIPIISSVILMIISLDVYVERSLNVFRAAYIYFLWNFRINYDLIPLNER